VSAHTDHHGPDPRHDGHTPACFCVSTRRPQSTNRWRHPFRIHLPRRRLNSTTRSNQKAARARSSRSSSHSCRQALGRSALPMLFSIEWRPSACVRKAVDAGGGGPGRVAVVSPASLCSRSGNPGKAGCSRGSHPQCPPAVKRTHEGGRRVTSKNRRAAFDTGVGAGEPESQTPLDPAQSKVAMLWPTRSPSRWTNTSLGARSPAITLVCSIAFSSCAWAPKSSRPRAHDQEPSSCSTTWKKDMVTRPTLVAASRIARARGPNLAPGVGFRGAARSDSRSDWFSPRRARVVVRTP
jgi:hypothetical protein